MAAWLGQTRGGCMLIIRPRKRRFRKSLRTARHKANSPLPRKHRHGQAAQLYHVMKDHHPNVGHIPEVMSCDVPTASQHTEPSSSSQGTVISNRPLPDMVAAGQVQESYRAWFDGSCEPINPGGTGRFGVVIKDNAGTVLLKERGFVGKGKAMSNNVAEYAGVLHILKYLGSRPPARVTIHGDSNLVINQLNGKWRVRKGLYLSIAVETKELLAYLRGLGWRINFCWIPREQNEECDALSKKTGDKPD